MCYNSNVHVQKIFILPHRRDWNVLGSGGFCKTQKFKEMYEALLEFSKGWGVLEKIPSVGEVWIFSGIITQKGELPLKRDIKACVYN